MCVRKGMGPTPTKVENAVQKNNQCRSAAVPRRLTFAGRAQHCSRNGRLLERVEEKQGALQDGAPTGRVDGGRAGVLSKNLCQRQNDAVHHLWAARGQLGQRQHENVHQTRRVHGLRSLRWGQVGTGARREGGTPLPACVGARPGDPQRTA